MIVDAKIACHWFVETPLSKQAKAFLALNDLVAPNLLRLKVARSLLSYVRIGQISEEQARAAIGRVGH